MNTLTLMECIREASASLDIEVHNYGDSYTRTIEYVDSEILLQALARVARAEYEGA